jgi:hypothetical protein
MTFNAITTMKTRSRGRRRGCMALLLAKVGRERNWRSRHR